MSELHTERKQIRGSKRKRKSMQEYSIPIGNLQGWVTDGFEVKTHKKLRQSNFTDVLDYAKWEKWYYEQHVKLCEEKIAQIIDAGTTPEERKEQQRINAFLKSLEGKYVGKAKELIERKLRELEEKK